MGLSNLINIIKSKSEKYPRQVNFLKKVSKNFLMKIMPTYPKIMRNEISEVKKVLKSSNWNMNYGKGLVHERLEEEFAEYIGTKYAVAVNTGGMAIQVSLRALGIKPGDEVIHQVDTCVADAFAVMAAGATPIFSDINKENFMLSRKSVERLISKNTKAIIPVHIWGNPDNMEMLKDVAQKNNLLIIEDAALALGASINGKRVGAFGNAGIFSFGCFKPIQAGEGGIITTNDEALAKEMRTIRSWGEMNHEYGIRDQKVLSWNGRISEIVAAVALEQLRAYPRHFKFIQETVTVFSEHIKNIEGIEIVGWNNKEIKSVYTQVVVKIDENLLGITKKELMKKLSVYGIEVWHANFEPINSLSFFRNGSWREWIIKGDINKVESNYNQVFKNSEEVYNVSGMGFSKSNFLSYERAKYLNKKLDHILLRRA